MWAASVRWACLMSDPSHRLTVGLRTGTIDVQIVDQPLWAPVDGRFVLLYGRRYSVGLPMKVYGTGHNQSGGARSSVLSIDHWWIALPLALLCLYALRLVRVLGKLGGCTNCGYP